jgi:hypothetical protein
MENNMQDCIDACTACHRSCLGMALTHCLEKGGRHVEPDHLRLMFSCAQLCATCADLQLGASPFASRLCALCADACAACADSCRPLDGMEDCVAACSRCAETCRAMSS